MRGRKLKISSSNDELVINSTSGATLSGHRLIDFSFYRLSPKDTSNLKEVKWFKQIFTLILCSNKLKSLGRKQ